MRQTDDDIRARVREGLLQYEQDQSPLPGIARESARDALIEQIIESHHRRIYPRLVSERDISSKRADPANPLFDPLKAAILRARQGDMEEAFWLVFLLTHFGKNMRGGWRYVADVYGKLGANPGWTWVATSSDVTGFREWLSANELVIREGRGAGGFGNHRKYESLSGSRDAGTGAVVESYVSWIAGAGSHEKLIAIARAASDGTAAGAFDELYKSMKAVHRFGRMARFDYLTMLEKLGFADITPGRTYLVGATGPLKGARLLFGSPSASARTLEARLMDLDKYVSLGSQVLEDSVCNWQKSPTYFLAFRG